MRCTAQDTAYNLQPVTPTLLIWPGPENAPLIREYAWGCSPAVLVLLLGVVLVLLLLPSLSPSPAQLVTITRNVVVAVLPESSVALHVTVVVPT